MPEYLTWQDRSTQVADHVIEWLTDSARRDERIAQLAVLKEQVGHGGASRRAADYLLDELARRSQPIVRTHFSFATHLDEAARGAA
jgi:lipid A disaccharide synthetase